MMLVEAPVRVLVIDNYAPFARSLQLMLAPEHQVQVSEDGQKALELLRTVDGFDVILCDLLMPGLSGMELYEELQRLHPGFEKRMVFMTGGAHTPGAREFLARVPNPCLEKPFAADALREALGQAAR